MSSGDIGVQEIVQSRDRPPLPIHRSGRFLFNHLLTFVNQRVDALSCVKMSLFELLSLSKLRMNLILWSFDGLLVFINQVTQFVLNSTGKYLLFILTDRLPYNFLFQTNNKVACFKLLPVGLNLLFSSLASLSPFRLTCQTVNIVT